MPKLSIYYKDEEPQSILLLGEAIIAISAKKYERALQIIDEVKELLQSQVNKEVSEE